MPTTLIFRPISATARNVPSTEPAPHMSYFISSMPSPGFSEMPPVSNVMPLPTSTTGAALAAPPWYCSTMNWGGSTEPRRDRQERAHLQRFELLLAEHFDLQLPVFGELLGGVGKVGRRADVARQVAEVARQVHAVGERGALLGGDLGGFLVAGVDAEHDALQGARRRCPACSSSA